jgi:predicted nicotinamide N-methyase
MATRSADPIAEFLEEFCSSSDDGDLPGVELGELATQVRVGGGANPRRGDAQRVAPYPHGAVSSTHCHVRVKDSAEDAPSRPSNCWEVCRRAEPALDACWEAEGWSGLRRLYRAGASPSVVAAVYMQHPYWQSLATQGELYREVLCEPAVCCFPPPRDYIQRVVRAVIKLFDTEQVELSEELLALLFAPQNRRINPSTTAAPTGYGAEETATGYRLLEFGGCRAIALRCSDSAFGGGSETSTVLWPAGCALAEFLCGCSALLAGRSVVELGCGCGTVGLAIARLGVARSVTLTDNQPAGLANAQHNLEVNEVLSAASVELCDWDEVAAAGGGGGGEGAGERQERQQQPLEPLPLLSPVLSSLDCIVAADVTYDPAACVALAQTIKVLLRCAVARNATEGRESPQPLCLIAAQEREPATWAMFCQQWLPFQPASNLATGSNGRTSCPPNLYIVELNASHVAKVWSQLGHGHAEGTLHIVAIGTRGAMDEVQRVTDVNG